MLLDRTTRTFLGVITLVAALFLTVNHVVDRAPLQDWWLAALLFLISAALWVWLWQEKIDEARALTLSQSDDVLPRSQEWIISKDPTVPAAEAVPAIPAPPEVEPETGEPVVTTDAETVAEAIDAEPVHAEPEDEQPESVVETADEAEPGGTPMAEAATVEEAEELAEAKFKGKPTGEVQPIDKEKAEAEEPKTVVEPKATPRKPDDLQRIDGIGPKYRQALLDAGVTTFAKLATMTDEELEGIVSGASMTRPPTLDTWREQASFAAKEDWDGLAKLQGELKGGRRAED